MQACYSSCNSFGFITLGVLFFVLLFLCFVFGQSPLVPKEFVPKQFMKFDDLDDAYEFYCDYAKMAGI
jgi:hypothetical protein